MTRTPTERRRNAVPNADGTLPRPDQTRPEVLVGVVCGLSVVKESIIDKAVIGSRSAQSDDDSLRSRSETSR